jgi:hypothetical protein
MIQSHLPEFFNGIDLLILHPMQMTPDIFETISRSKIQNPSIDFLHNLASVRGELVEPSINHPSTPLRANGQHTYFEVMQEV